MHPTTLTRRQIAEVANVSVEWIARLMAENSAPQPLTEREHYYQGSKPLQYDRETALLWIGWRIRKIKPVAFKIPHNLFPMRKK